MSSSVQWRIYNVSLEGMPMPRQATKNKIVCRLSFLDIILPKKGFKHKLPVHLRDFIDNQKYQFILARRQGKIPLSLFSIAGR